MGKMKIKFALHVLIIAMVIGCISRPDGITENETSQREVPPAPRQIYIKAGQVEQFTYLGHKFTINYTSLKTLEVSLDGIDKQIQKEMTDGRGIYWSERGFNFTIKPVSWEIRDGQRIPLYEKTWNTTELYFEVSGEGK